MAQDEAFVKFKELCSSEGLLRNEADAAEEDEGFGVWDDNTLMRFLRARNFKPEDALKQYKTTREWREANQLNQLYETIDVAKFEETHKVYPYWTGRLDRNGAPLCVYEIRHLTSAAMAEYQKSCATSAAAAHIVSREPESMLRLFCTYEAMTRFVFPLLSSVQGKPVTVSVSIIDVTGVGLMQFWRLRTHMQSASVLATAHYPETLGKTFIVGAPSYFSTVWGWVNKWFDQNTVSKMNIVPHGKEFEVLSQFIEPENIPKKYGGKHEMEYGTPMDLSSQISQAIEWLDEKDGEVIREIPKGPVRWLPVKEGKRTAIAVGYEDGVQRHRAAMSIAA